MKVFGERWGNWSDAEFVDTPVGRECIYCREETAAGDLGVLMPYSPADGPATLAPVHRECLVWATLGKPEDERGSMRESARAAVLRLSLG